MAYDRQIATAEKLIRKFGELCELRTTVVTTPDPAKPWITETSQASQLGVPCVFLDFGSSRSASGGEQYFNGTLVVAGDKKILISTPTLTSPVVVGCQVVRASGEVWQCVGFRDLNPNGQHILYTLQGRR